MFPEPSRQVSICEHNAHVVQKVRLPEASPRAALSSRDQEVLYLVSSDWHLGTVASASSSSEGRCLMRERTGVIVPPGAPQLIWAVAEGHQEAPPVHFSAVTRFGNSPALSPTPWL